MQKKARVGFLRMLPVESMGLGYGKQKDKA